MPKLTVFAAERSLQRMISTPPASSPRIGGILLQEAGSESVQSKVADAVASHLENRLPTPARCKELMKSGAIEDWSLLWAPATGAPIAEVRVISHETFGREVPRGLQSGGELNGLIFAGKITVDGLYCYLLVARSALSNAR